MADFKVGDVVECISDISTSEGGPVTGEIFTITATRGNFIGFPLERLTSRHYSAGTIEGTEANWGVHCFKLVETKTQTMNKYNLKVGDKVHWHDPSKQSAVFIIGKVDESEITFFQQGTDRLETINYSFERIEQMAKTKNFLLADRDITKEMTKEIVGYKLKDEYKSKEDSIIKALSSGSTVTTKFTAFKEGYSFQENSGYSHKAADLGVLDLWFEPVYKATKPTEVKVDTKAGVVTVTATQLSLRSETPTSVKDAEIIFDRFEKFKNVGSVASGAVVIETFKVGCKTFHVDDITALKIAINQVK